MLQAIYICQSSALMVLIPKRRGMGYCKSVFGWHSKNDKAILFDEIAPAWFISGDYTDLDGYLHIVQNKLTNINKYT